MLRAIPRLALMSMFEENKVVEGVRHGLVGSSKCVLQRGFIHLQKGPFLEADVYDKCNV